MLKTLFISLGLLFLSSCNSGGDGGGGAPVSSVTSSTTGDKTGADDFQLSEKDLEKIEDDFQKINKTIVSENFKATIKKVSQDFVGFDLRKTGIYNLDNIPTNYVLSYHRDKGKRNNNLFDLYKVKNYGEIVESYTPTESLSNKKIGKFKKILHSSENTFVITQRPIQLLRLSTATNEIELVSSFPVKERRIHYLSSNNEGLCVISRIEDSFVAYHYQFSNQIFKETAFDHQLKNAKFAGSFHCDSEKIVLVKRENKKYQLFKKGFDNSPLEELSLSRDPNVTYSFYKSNAKTILSLKDTSGRSYFDLSEASAAPLAQRPVRDSNPFRKTKIAIVKDRPSIDNPIVTLVYSNEKTIDIQMSYYKARIVDLKKIKNTLVAIVEGNSLHDFDSESELFSKIGDSRVGRPTQFGAIGEDVYFITGNTKLFKWEMDNKWSMGTASTIFLKRNDLGQNPLFFDNLNQYKLQSNTIKKVDVLKNAGDNLLLVGRAKDNNGQKAGGVIAQYQPESRSIINNHSLSDNFLLRGIKKRNDKYIYGTRYIGSKEDFIDNNSYIGEIDSQSLKNEVKKYPLISIKDIHSIHLIAENIMTFISKNKHYVYNSVSGEVVILHTYSGVHYKNTMMMPNRKLLTLTNKNVLLVDPIKKETEVLYTFLDDEIDRVYKVSFLEDKLLVVDKQRSLFVIKLPFGKLNLIDEK